MKPKEFQQMKTKPPVELKKELETMRVRLNSLKFDLSAGKVKNIREIRGVKKNIAQLLTLLSAKSER